MGFEEDEALDNIEPVQRTLDFQRDLFGPQEEPEAVFRYIRPRQPRKSYLSLKEAEHDGLLVRETAEGQVEIAITGWINQDQRDRRFPRRYPSRSEKDLPQPLPNTAPQSRNTYPPPNKDSHSKSHA